MQQECLGIFNVEYMLNKAYHYWYSKVCQICEYDKRLGCSLMPSVSGLLRWYMAWKMAEQKISEILSTTTFHQRKGGERGVKDQL